MRHTTIARVDDQRLDVPDLAIARTNPLAPMDIYLPEGNGLVNDDLRASHNGKDGRPSKPSLHDVVPEAAGLREFVLFLGRDEVAEIVDRAAKTHPAAPFGFHESDGHEAVEETPMLHPHDQMRHRPSSRIDGYTPTSPHSAPSLHLTSAPITNSDASAIPTSLIDARLSGSSLTYRPGLMSTACPSVPEYTKAPDNRHREGDESCSTTME